MQLTHMSKLLSSIGQPTFNLFPQAKLTKVVSTIDTRMLIDIVNKILKKDAVASRKFGIYIYNIVISFIYKI